MANSDSIAALDLFVKTLHYDPENAAALVNAAVIAQREQKMTDGALGYLLRADRIYVRHGDSQTPKYAALMLRIADIYKLKNDEAKAQVYLKRAVEIWNKLKKDWPLEYASFLSEIGEGYILCNEFATAEDYFSMAQEVIESSNASSTLRASWLQQRFADLLCMSNNYSAAADSYLKSLNALGNLGFGNSVKYGDVLLKYGFCLRNAGKVFEAQNVFEQSYDLFEIIGDVSNMRNALTASQSLFDPIQSRNRN